MTHTGTAQAPLPPCEFARQKPNLILRSRATHGVSKDGGKRRACGPSFETLRNAQLLRMRIGCAGHLETPGCRFAHPGYRCAAPQSEARGLIQHHKPSEYFRARDQFGQIYADSTDGARVMALVMHPYIMGARVAAMPMDRNGLCRLFAMRPDLFLSACRLG